MGCLGTIVSLMSVGLSTNFWMALVGRALGGALNGNMGVIQTMVGEMITNPQHERELPNNDALFKHADFPQPKLTLSCLSSGQLEQLSDHRLAVCSLNQPRTSLTTSLQLVSLAASHTYCLTWYALA